MGIPTTFAEYFADLLTHTGTWEVRDAFDIDGNNAFEAPVAIVGHLKSINVAEGGIVRRMRDIRSPLLDPTAIFICAGDIAITALDRLTFDLLPGFPYIVETVDDFYDEHSVPFYRQCTLKYETKPTTAP